MSKTKGVVVAWLLGSTSLSIVAATLSLIHQELTYLPEPNVVGRPIDELVRVLTLIPLGWFISVIMPWGWLNLAGLVWAVKKRSLKPLGLSAVGSLVFGVLWPTWFMGMMGI